MKKKLSIDVLRGLEPYVQYNNDLFVVNEDESTLLTVKDKEKNSDFQFVIKGSEQSQGKFYLRIHIKPEDCLGSRKSSYLVEPTKVGECFGKWVNLLIEYNNTKTFFDDPIISAYTDEYYAEFEFVDADADLKPFDSNLIIAIDSILENTQQQLPQYITESNSSQIEEIQNNITELRNNLTLKSKKWVAKKLSVIWAKLSKQGVRFIKDFVKEGRKQLIDVGVKFLIEIGKNTIEI